MLGLAHMIRGWLVNKGGAIKTERVLISEGRVYVNGVPCNCEGCHSMNALGTKLNSLSVNASNDRTRRVNAHTAIALWCIAIAALVVALVGSLGLVTWYG